MRGKTPPPSSSGGGGQGSDDAMDSAYVGSRCAGAGVAGGWSTYDLTEEQSAVRMTRKKVEEECGMTVKGDTVTAATSDCCSVSVSDWSCQADMASQMESEFLMDTHRRGRAARRSCSVQDKDTVGEGEGEGEDVGGCRGVRRAGYNVGRRGGFVSVVAVVVALQVLFSGMCEGLLPRLDRLEHVQAHKGGAFVPLFPPINNPSAFGALHRRRVRLMGHAGMAFFWRHSTAASPDTSQDTTMHDSSRHGFARRAHKRNGSTPARNVSPPPPRKPPLRQAMPASRLSTQPPLTALRMTKDPSSNEAGYDDKSQTRGQIKRDKIKKLKVRASRSESNLDLILRVGSMGAVNGTRSLVRMPGVYSALQTVKNVVDSTAGWRTPPLSGASRTVQARSEVRRQRSISPETQELARGGSPAVRRQRGVSPSKDWSLQAGPPKGDGDGLSLEWISPSYLAEEKALVAEAMKKSKAPTARRSSTPELRGDSSTSDLQLKAQSTTEIDEDDDEEDDSVDAVVDIKRTLLNIGLFMSTIAGWKGLWDFQDKVGGSGLLWWHSVVIGIAMYILRFKVDDVLDTHDVHEEDWFELFSEMPELTWNTASDYGKIYLSSGLVFCSSLFIWRGLWAGFDAAGLDWLSTLIIGAVSYVTLSVLQLELEIQRSIEDPDGTRSPSLFSERDALMRPLTLVPEEYRERKSGATSESSDDEAPPPPTTPPPAD